jgi:hypothetical protein
MKRLSTRVDDSFLRTTDLSEGKVWQSTTSRRPLATPSTRAYVRFLASEHHAACFQPRRAAFGVQLECH